MKKAITVTILLILLPSPTIADQLILKNGDRLTGKIVKSDGSKLVVQTELVGEVSVDLSAVNSITSDQPLYVTLADGRTVSGMLTARLRIKRSCVPQPRTQFPSTDRRFVSSDPRQNISLMSVH